jgi:uncharacterized membrane protein YtjA (UPF0391 family)
MLTWTLIFLVISLIAGALGISGISGGARTIARLLFMIFLIALVVADGDELARGGDRGHAEARMVAKVGWGLGAVGLIGHNLTADRAGPSSARTKS